MALVQIGVAWATRRCSAVLLLLAPLVTLVVAREATSRIFTTKIETVAVGQIVRKKIERKKFDYLIPFGID